MQNDEGLVERLRAWAPLVSSGYEVPAAGQCMAEAADSIEQLEAENARLREALKKINGEGGFDSAEHQAHRLRSAIEERGGKIVWGEDE